MCVGGGGWLAVAAAATAVMVERAALTRQLSGCFFFRAGLPMQLGVCCGFPINPGLLLLMLLCLVLQVENEDLVFTLETMVEKFGDEIAPYAVSQWCHSPWTGLLSLVSPWGLREYCGAVCCEQFNPHSTKMHCFIVCLDAKPSLVRMMMSPTLSLSLCPVQVNLAQNLTAAFWKYSGMADGADEDDECDDMGE